MEEEDNKSTNSLKSIVAAGKTSTGFYIPRRYIVCFMMFSGFLIMNCQRSCLSVAIVAMSSRTKHFDGDKWVVKKAEFRWNSEKKGLLLGAFFYGYLVLQIPGGAILGRFGGKKVLGIAVTISSFIHLLLPEIARFNEDFFFAGRVSQGLALGVALPTNLYIWGKWAPLKEKASLVSFSVAGLSAGMLTAYPISGLLCRYGFAGGWPSVFYVFGGLGMLWVFTWLMLVTNDPLSHPSIRTEELAVMDQIHTKELKEQIPWLKILGNLPVWGVITANVAFDASYYTLLITMPLFLRDVHKFNVATTGIVAAMPWFFMTVMISVTGILSDRFLKMVMSVGATRKLVYNVGVIGSGIFLIIAGYIKGSESTVAILCVAVAFYGLSFSAYMVNPMDIAPRYSDTIIGVSNALATIPGFVGPAIVGVVTKHRKASEWIEVFYGLAFVGIFGGFVFTVIGSGEGQDWANYQTLPDIEEAEDEMKTLIDNKGKLDK